MFKGNYKTSDDVFIVDIDMSTLTTEMRTPKPNWTAKDITYNFIDVYNKTTDRMSNKSLYVDKNNRLYFKGKSDRGKPKRYYVDELVEVKDE